VRCGRAMRGDVLTRTIADDAARRLGAWSCTTAKRTRWAVRTPWPTWSSHPQPLQRVHGVLQRGVEADVGFVEETIVDLAVRTGLEGVAVGGHGAGGGGDVGVEAGGAGGQDGGAEGGRLSAARAHDPAVEDIGDDLAKEIALGTAA